MIILDLKDGDYIVYIGNQSFYLLGLDTYYPYLQIMRDGFSVEELINGGAEQKKLHELSPKARRTIYAAYNIYFEKLALKHSKNTRLE